MDALQEALLVIGFMGGVIGIVQSIYFFGSWKGKITTMVETLWDIYVKDALSRRPDLVSHASPYKLKPEVEQTMPEKYKIKLDAIRCRFENKEDIVSGFTVVKHLGLDTIDEASKEMKLGIQETVAVLSTYLEEHANHHHTGGQK